MVNESVVTTKAGKVALSADHEVRLERLEHQLAHILYKPSKEKVCAITVLVMEIFLEKSANSFPCLIQFAS